MADDDKPVKYPWEDEADKAAGALRPGAGSPLAKGGTQSGYDWALDKLAESASAGRAAYDAAQAAKPPIRGSSNPEQPPKPAAYGDGASSESIAISTDPNRPKPDAAPFRVSRAPAPSPRINPNSGPMEPPKSRIDREGGQRTP